MSDTSYIRVSANALEMTTMDVRESSAGEAFCALVELARKMFKKSRYIAANASLASRACFSER